MDQYDIFKPLLVLKLTDRLKKRLALDISDCTAHFDDGDFSIFCSRIPIEFALDLIGDVGDNLYGTPAEVAAALFLEYGPVDFSGGDVGVFCQTLVYKALIVAKIQVCLCPVVCDKYLAVLYRIHRAGIDIDIRIEFLHGNSISSGLQKTSERCGGDPFAETGYNTSGNKYIFYSHNKYPPVIKITNE